jgi:uncharacterized protein (TIGR03437 family)
VLLALALPAIWLLRIADNAECPDTISDIASEISELSLLLFAMVVVVRLLGNEKSLKFRDFPRGSLPGGYDARNGYNGVGAAFGSCLYGQTPTITSVVNAASGNVQSLPNGGIAQGAIFTVVGSNLGPAALSIASSPFTSTSLLGTSVNVTVKGTTVGMLMYYTSRSQVAGVLPSNTPVGTGTVTVTYNGATSASAPITVVQSNAGIFTTPAGGSSAAVVTYPDYSVVSAIPANPCGGPNTVCGAANPKDVLTLWLTGLGPVSAPDSSGPQPGNMANLPLKLFLGGVQAPVSYQGRSGCCIGVGQVVFTVPDNVSTGWAVPLFIQIDAQISNYTWISVANGSRTCTPTNPTFTPSAIATVAAGGAITSTQVKLRRRPTNNGQGIVDRADAQFQKMSAVPGMSPFLLTLIDLAPVALATFSMIRTWISPRGLSNFRAESTRDRA